jgi:hypothetical protein
MGAKAFRKFNEIQSHHLVHQRSSKGWVGFSDAKRPCHDIDILFLQQPFKPRIFHFTPLRRAMIEKSADHSVSLTRATVVRAIMQFATIGVSVHGASFSFWWNMIIGL